MRDAASSILVASTFLFFYFFFFFFSFFFLFFFPLLTFPHTHTQKGKSIRTQLDFEHITSNCGIQRRPTIPGARDHIVATGGDLCTQDGGPLLLLKEGCAGGVLPAHDEPVLAGGEEPLF